MEKSQLRQVIIDQQDSFRKGEELIFRDVDLDFLHNVYSVKPFHCETTMNNKVLNNQMTDKYLE